MRERGVPRVYIAEKTMFRQWSDAPIVAAVGSLLGDEPILLYDGNDARGGPPFRPSLSARLDDAILLWLVTAALALLGRLVRRHLRRRPAAVRRYWAAIPFITLLAVAAATYLFMVIQLIVHVPATLLPVIPSALAINSWVHDITAARAERRTTTD